MEKRIAEWQQRIDATTEAFKNAFSQLSTAELNRKPNAATWSIAQNIDHLIVINSSYFPAIDEIRANKQKIGWFSKLGFMTRLLGKMILGAVEPTRKRHIKTFPVWEPSQSAISSDILAKFEEHQEALKKLIAACEDLLQEGRLIASPANKHIVYTLEAAFDIIVTHEERHLAQAKSLLLA